MSSIISLLKRIEENPLLYLGKKDLHYLRQFVSGYLVCEEDNGRSESTMVFESFKNYFNKIYGLRSFYGYDDVLLQESETREEAFDKFFELFNSFLVESEINQ